MRVRLEFHDDCLLAITDGPYDRAVAQESMVRALQACSERGVMRLLIDGRASRDLSLCPIASTLPLKSLPKRPLRSASHS
jgi:hypothetical protein